MKEIFMIRNHLNEGLLTSPGAFLSKEKAEEACLDMATKYAEQARMKYPDKEIEVQIDDDKAYKSKRFEVIAKGRRYGDKLKSFRVVAIPFHEET